MVENSIFKLHVLGWVSFQNLCGTILREVLGQTFQVFADSADAGRDGAFSGTWKQVGSEDLTGSFVVQCKFTAREGTVLQVSHVSDELAKVRRLAEKGLAQNYLLFTNAALRAPVEAELREKFLSIPGVERFKAYGGEWITQQIRENQRLRTLVPRVYGLGDLTEILDERIYEQAKEILSWLGDELERFVVTDAHHRSVKALRERGFVFLLGDPGSGKSTIAAALALAAADTWGCRVVKVRNADDFTRHWNPREPNQFFWVDDAFGQGQHERERSLEWNHTLPYLNAAVKRGARVIFTSRTYIYQAAIEDLKGSVFPLLLESQVVIQVEKLTRKEREQILYNHLRLGDQPPAFRRSLKPILPEVAAHEKFLPETARRLGNSVFTNKLILNSDSVLHFVAEQEAFLRDIIIGFGDANRAALGLAFIRGGKLKTPIDLTTEEEHALKVMNSSLGAVTKALKNLKGSMLVLELESGDTIFRFKHPTIRDTFGGVLSDDPNLMDVYLRGARPPLMINEITCGEVGIRGAKLVIPKERFPLVLNRLRELMKDRGGERRVCSFLATRCSADFLRVFLEFESSFLSKLKLQRYILWLGEAKLFATLHKYGLLPETQRQYFVHFALENFNRHIEWRFMLRANFRAIFKPAELRAFRAHVRRELTSARLKWEIELLKMHWEGHKNKDFAEPESHFRFFREELDAFEFEFKSNKAMKSRINVSQRRIDTMVERLKKEWEKKEGDLEAEIESDEIVSERSIFEDVDE